MKKPRDLEAMKNVSEGRRQLSVEAQSLFSEDNSFVLVSVTDSAS